MHVPLSAGMPQLWVCVDSGPFQTAAKQGIKRLPEHVVDSWPAWRLHVGVVCEPRAYVRMFVVGHGPGGEPVAGPAGAHPARCLAGAGVWSGRV